MTLSLTSILTLALTATTVTARHTSQHLANSVRGGEWHIVEANGTSTLTAEKQPVIAFDADGKYHGNASVNQFFGNYTLKGSRLTLSEAGMTRMLGPNMEVEDAIVKALGSTAEIRVAGDSAFIRNASGETVMKLLRSK